jgi:hypothetical protein
MKKGAKILGPKIIDVVGDNSLSENIVSAQ